VKTHLKYHAELLPNMMWFHDALLIAVAVEERQVREGGRR
jgi:hypothetical protein